MFAAVFYLKDRQYANVPISYIKDFDPAKYDKGAIYKSFWNRKLHVAQDNKRNENVTYLKSLTMPPRKESWKKDEGEKYYPSYIVRLADSYEELVTSLASKRATIPANLPQVDETSSSEDPSISARYEKEEKTKEEKARKKTLQCSKLAKAKGILIEAKKTRKDLFDEGTDSDVDPEVVPITEVKEAEEARNYWEEEYMKATARVEKLQAEKESLEAENKSLRALNLQMQEKIFSMPAEQDLQNAGTSRQMLDFAYAEVEGTENLDLGGGVVLHRQTLYDLHNLPDCKKFTKNLANAIWGRKELGSKSVTGQKCRNRSGPKKMVPGEQVAKEGEDAKKAMTPEKLAVISGQMRDYLRKRKIGPLETEEIMKKRNLWLCDAIQYSKKMNL